MRILHILNDLSDKGNGIVNVTVDLACEQVAQGHQVAIAAGGGEFIELVESRGVRFYALNQRRQIANFLRAILQFRKICRQFQPDIVHAHMRSGLLVAWAATRTRRVPLVAHLHNVHDRESNLMRIADRVIAVSASVRDTMAERGIPLAKMRVVVNAPLNSPRTPAIDSLPPRALQRPAILTVAGMNHRKGIAELLEAFDLVAAGDPAPHLYLVGDGTERSLFENIAARSPFADRIHFEGYQSQPQAYMLGADIFVLASRRDSNPLVLMEARQAGCVIVATNVDGIPEALDGGEAGLLVPAQDPTALAASIRTLLHDEPLRRTLAARARQGCEHFSCRRMATEVEAIYSELLRQRRVRALNGAWAQR
jgi:glycosyltransferase involved in cell wall biosynthesis